MRQTSSQLASKKKWRKNNPEKAREMSRRHQRTHLANLRKKIYNHYGRMCACCGQSEEFFLTIGHKDGSGAKHRHQLLTAQGRKSTANLRAGATMAVYRDIIRRGFPEFIQIECMNCNLGAARNGGVCPHKTAKITSDEHPTPTHES
jgi:hypothetical protein